MNPHEPYHTQKQNCIRDLLRDGVTRIAELTCHLVSVTRREPLRHVDVHSNG